MTCEQAQNLLSAQLDGELAPIDRDALDAHLAQCANCQAERQALREQHDLLTRAFAPRRQAAEELSERVILHLSHPAAAGRLGFSRWLPVAIAAAAGFLLALLIFQPWTGHRRDVAQGPRTAPAGEAVTQPAGPVIACAKLALATGRVDIRPSGASDWRAMETAGDVPADARVRTGADVRCEFQCPDGSTVRMNEKTELRFAAPRTLELAEGQVWSGVAKAPSPFVVSTRTTTVTAVGTRFDLADRAGKTSLIVFEGATRVQRPGMETVVRTGEGLDFDGAKAGQPHRVYDLARAARWIDEILILKGRDNPELNERIDDLLARLGDDKMRFLYEGEIRSLGDHCVLPLTRYIQSERSAGENSRRRHAATLVADCAQPWSIPYLIELLSDRDGEVRAAAGRGLRRLTNSEIGSDAEWRDSSSSARQELVREWQQWWEHNKEKIPGAARQPPQPPEPARKA